MVAPERERAALSRADELVQRQGHAVALAEAEPADPCGQPLERDALPGQLDPAPQRVAADDFHHRVLAPPQVLGIPREADPPEATRAAGEDRPYVRGHEPWNRQGLFDPVSGRLRADPVPVLEDDAAALPVGEHRFHVGRERSEDAASKLRVVRIGAGRFCGREASWHVAAQRVVGGSLVGDDVELDSVLEQARHDVGRVADEGGHGGADRVEMGCERLSSYPATTSTQPSRRRRSARAGSTSTTSARPPFRATEALSAAHPAQARRQDALPAREPSKCDPATARNVSYVNPRIPCVPT